MGNQTSSSLSPEKDESPNHGQASPLKLNATSDTAPSERQSASADGRSKFKSFPGSAILEKTFCGRIDTTDPSEYVDETFANRLLRKADVMCVSSPYNSGDEDPHVIDDEDSILASVESKNSNRDNNQQQGPDTQRIARKSSKLLARALVSEVTDNPKTMKPADMAAREKKLLRAQEAASAPKKVTHEITSTQTGPNGSKVVSTTMTTTKTVHKPVGMPGAGIGPPHVLSSLAYACTGEEAAVHTPADLFVHTTTDAAKTGLSEADLGIGTENSNILKGLDLEQALHKRNPHAVTIALCMSRRHPTVGHPDTVTRQTAFDFNQLQDRAYKFVSSTDGQGWHAGGGEPDVTTAATPQPESPHHGLNSPAREPHPKKQPHPDTVHIPIMHLDCANAAAVDQVIHVLASGDIFIPHMAVLPESLSVQGTPLPDLMVRFNCERSDDTPADDWPNWVLEFMHNQLYEYFYNAGAIWMPRPFAMTLAKGVRWKTVKHMNRYFVAAEQVLAGWAEQGPQCLSPQDFSRSASREELARPHGLYLLRTVGGQLNATNYFCPNFEPPYTTKMTRSLLDNVLAKSWDKKRREWSSQALPRVVSPGTLLASACGCGATGGFVAREVTTVASSVGLEGVVLDPKTSAEEAVVVRRDSPTSEDVDDDDDDDPFAEPLKQNSQEAEEKKSDEEVTHHNSNKPADSFHPESRFTTVQDDRPVSVAASGFMSVAASGTTTVVHTNITSATQGKELFSDEDWPRMENPLSPLSNMGDTRKSNMSDPPGDKVGGQHCNFQVSGCEFVKLTCSALFVCNAGELSALGHKETRFLSRCVRECRSTKTTY